MRIIIDTREKKPFRFYGYGVLIERGTLKTGDYSVAPPDGSHLDVAIERKSLADLYISISKGRQRFQRELERAQDTLKYFAIVVECSFMGLKHKPHRKTRVSPKSVVGTLMSWSVRYNVPVWTPGGKRSAEKVTFRLLDFCYEHFSEHGAEARKARAKRRRKR